MPVPSWKPHFLVYWGLLFKECIPNIDLFIPCFFASLKKNPLLICWFFLALYKLVVACLNYFFPFLSVLILGLLSAHSGNSVSPVQGFFFIFVWLTVCHSSLTKPSCCLSRTDWPACSCAICEQNR